MHHHTRNCTFIISSIKVFPTDGLEGIGQFYGQRSPDITTLDFFLWGYVTNIVYRTKVWGMTDLKQRISIAIATIVESMLQQTWQKIENRLNVLRATIDAHIQV